MRYYDTKTTPIDGKTPLEDGANRYAQTDERVSIYFQKIDPVKYDRGFDDEGFPTVLEYILQDDGTRYSAYKLVDGIMVPDEEAIAIKQMEEMISGATRVTEEHIQAPIDKYNRANGVVFTDVHACSSYLNNPEYTHYPFCSSVWNWSVEVWETARDVQSQVIAGEIEMPSEEEFIEMLPEFMED